LDEDAAALVAASSGAPSLEEMGVDVARAYLAKSVRARGQGPAVADVQDDVVPGGPRVRVYRPGGPDGLPVVTFLHGGGWVIGSVDTADPFCHRLAVAAGCTVVSVAYGLAPEAPWPAAVDDAERAFVWAAEHVAGDAPHVVAGESAGGNVAAAAVGRVVAAGSARVDRLVLAYPTVETTQDRESHRLHGHGWPLRNRDLAWFARLYVPEMADRCHPDVSLLAGDARGMPRTTILLAGCDPLRDEGLAYAAHLAAAGVAVDVHVFEGQIHGFLTFGEDVLPTSAEALGVVANAVLHA
jgi:acetyl esterase